MRISGRVWVRVCRDLMLGAATSVVGLGLASAEQFTVVTAVPDKMTAGTTAFVDTVGKQRIVEIDSRGTVVWQCSLRGSPFKIDHLSSGADLKWIKADDTF